MAGAVPAEEALAEADQAALEAARAHHTADLALAAREDRVLASVRDGAWDIIDRITAAVAVLAVCSVS